MRGAYPEGENLCLLLCRNRDVGDQRVCLVIEFFQLEVTKLEMRWIDTVTSKSMLPRLVVQQMYGYIKVCTSTSDGNSSIWLQETSRVVRLRHPLILCETLQICKGKF